MITCPKCNCENVSKVSIVFQNGAREIVYKKPLYTEMFGKLIWYGEIAEKGIDLSSADFRLAPPKRPFYYGPFLSSEQGKLSSILRVAISFAIITLLWTLSINPIKNLLKEINTITDNLDVSNILWVGTVILAFLVCIQLVFDIIYVRTVKEKIPAWEKALQKWHLLYHCSTCDCVFFDQNTYVSSGNINELIQERVSTARCAMNCSIAKSFTRFKKPK